MNDKIYAIYIGSSTITPHIVSVIKAKDGSEAINNAIKNNLISETEAIYALTETIKDDDGLEQLTKNVEGYLQTLSVVHNQLKNI
jgi:mevalonate kinase